MNCALRGNGRVRALRRCILRVRGITRRLYDCCWTRVPILRVKTTWWVGCSRRVACCSLPPCMFDGKLDFLYSICTLGMGHVVVGMFIAVAALVCSLQWLVIPRMYFTVHITTPMPMTRCCNTQGRTPMNVARRFCRRNAITILEQHWVRKLSTNIGALTPCSSTHTTKQYLVCTNATHCEKVECHAHTKLTADTACPWHLAIPAVAVAAAVVSRRLQGRQRGPRVCSPQAGR